MDSSQIVNRLLTLSHYMKNKINFSEYKIVGICLLVINMRINGCGIMKTNQTVQRMAEDITV